MNRRVRAILSQAIDIAKLERERRWAAGKVGQLSYATCPGS